MAADPNLDAAVWNCSDAVRCLPAHPLRSAASITLALGFLGERSPRPTIDTPLRPAPDWREAQSRIADAMEELCRARRHPQHDTPCVSRDHAAWHLRAALALLCEAPRG